jgi:hypothetical protein
MVDSVEFASVLKDEHLVRQVLSTLFCRYFNFSPLRDICLGDVKDFATWLAVCPLVPTKLRLAFIGADIGEG